MSDVLISTINLHCRLHRGKSLPIPQEVKDLLAIPDLNSSDFNKDHNTEETESTLIRERRGHPATRNLNSNCNLPPRVNQVFETHFNCREDICDQADETVDNRTPELTNSGAHHHTRKHAGSTEIGISDDEQVSSNLVKLINSTPIITAKIAASTPKNYSNSLCPVDSSCTDTDSKSKFLNSSDAIGEVSSSVLNLPLTNKDLIPIPASSKNQLTPITSNFKDCVILEGSFEISIDVWQSMYHNNQLDVSLVLEHPSNTPSTSSLKDISSDIKDDSDDRGYMFLKRKGVLIEIGVQYETKLLKDLYKNSMFDESENNLNNASKSFIKAQLRNIDKSHTRRRWTDEDKAFALSMEKFKKCMNLISILLLIFDEMSLSSGLYYQRHKQRIVDSENLEHLGRTEKMANHALVFMVRGVRRSWKQDEKLRKRKLHHEPKAAKKLKSNDIQNGKESNKGLLDDGIDITEIAVNEENIEQEVDKLIERLKVSDEQQQKISSILRPQFSTSPTEYGRQNERVAISKYSDGIKQPIHPSGSFIDIKSGFLAASPDGIINAEEIAEVKCLHKVAVSGLQLIDSIKISHNYYYQGKKTYEVAEPKLTEEEELLDVDGQVVYLSKSITGSSKSIEKFNLSQWVKTDLIDLEAAWLPDDDLNERLRNAWGTDKEFERYEYFNTNRKNRRNLSSINILFRSMTETLDVELVTSESKAVGNRIVQLKAVRTQSIVVSRAPAVVGDRRAPKRSLVIDNDQPSSARYPLPRVDYANVKMWDLQQFDKANIAERHRMCQELLAGFDAEAVANLDPAALSNYKTLQDFYTKYSSTVAASEEATASSTSQPTPKATVPAAAEKIISRRQKQRAKKKAARERTLVAIATRLGITKDAPITAGDVPVGAAAAAPGQSRSASTERNITPPPASPSPSATYSEVLQRPSSAMSCASAVSQTPTEDPDSDSEEGYTTVDGRNKRRRRDSPHPGRALVEASASPGITAPRRLPPVSLPELARLAKPAPSAPTLNAGWQQAACNIPSSHQPRPGVPAITSYFANDKTITIQNDAKVAELKLMAFVVEHNLPFLVMDHLPDLIRSVCPDSKIAQEIKCSRTKATTIVNDCMSLPVKENIISKINNRYYSLMVDETTDIATKKSYAVILRLFDVEENEVTNCFFGLLEVTESTAEALFAAISINQLILSKFQQKVKCMSSTEKQAILLFAEIRIKKDLQYSSPHDFIEGFEDLGVLDYGFYDLSDESLDVDKENEPNNFYLRKQTKTNRTFGYRRPVNQTNTFHDTEKAKRTLEPSCSSSFCAKSKKRQSKEIKEYTRQESFSTFWENLSWDQRKTLVCSLVTSTIPKERKNPNNQEFRRDTTLE
ncbi:hypothetical protein ILUMI_04975 [Ignelater luminosus]|uniref:DUF4371 domain-containing protein n=1 Tax=Ignelater luminosus TaxID=2038154 RepID=A0A8K0D852_IGNLU|nr:hypothetical protein ILUMI_04975 [Ignelater luminosus]